MNHQQDFLLNSFDEEEDFMCSSSAVNRVSNRLSFHRFGVDKAVSEAVEVFLNAFTMNSLEQRKMAKAIKDSLDESLKQKNAGQPIRWNYVPALPSGRVFGKCLALDFGCSDHYFQVSVCDVRDGENYAFEPIDTQAFLLTRTLRHVAMDRFCDFVAVCVRKVMQDYNLSATPKEPIYMGIVAGFEMRVKPQLSSAHATVVHTFKDYGMPGFIGKNFVAMFHKAFDRANINVQIVTVLNDTVGTLLAGIHEISLGSDQSIDCSISVVSHRCGANMAFLETDKDFLDMCSTDKRLLLRCPRGSGNCAVVSTEAGSWIGKKDELLPHANLIERHLRTAIGSAIRLECLTSGFWYPDILRRSIYVLKVTGALSINVDDSSNLQPSSCFEIFTQCDQWRADESSSVMKLVSELQPHLGVKHMKSADAIVIAELCHAIVSRTAEVMAIGIIVLAQRIYGKSFPKRMAIAYHGNMFKCVSQLKNLLEASLKGMVPSDTEILLVNANMAFGCAVSAINAGDRIRVIGSL